MAERTPDYQPGQMIPGTVYRVHRVLGAGGMGTVYDVEDTTIGKRYVLKTLHGDLADRADLAARLAREARALAKLQHPNIVEVYTSGTTQDTLRLPYYVMERLQGQSLRVALERKGRLTLEQSYDIAIDLLDALDHAHEFGIVHRDVKPDNLFITRGRDGRALAKLLDFGIIKLATGSTQHTGGRFIGTFRYAPPEQILGRDVTAQSDLYAAGLVLYEMLAGRGPFDDFAGEVEIGKAHIDVQPPPLSRFVQVPPEVERLVASSLDKKPENRPKDAFSFASALRELKKQLASRVKDVGAQATVEQVVTQTPASSAQPPRPMVTSGTLGRTGTMRMDVVPLSGPDTRLESPAAIHAATSPGPPVSGPASPRLAHTADYGTPLPPGATVAEAPQTMTHAPASAQPFVLGHGPGVDRNAETRASAPLPASMQRPSSDTAAIPLVSARSPSPSSPPEYQAPVQQAETFGAQTTDAPARRRGASGGLVAALIGVLVLVGAGITGLVVWKHSRTEETSPGDTASVTSVETPPASSASAAPVEATASAASVEATASAAESATPALLPAAHGASPASAAPHATAAPAVKHPVTPPPVATSHAHPHATATSTGGGAPTATVHRPGSGL